MTKPVSASNRQDSSYPGGKSGSGIYQRLINLIPRHRILVVPFAGHCGVVRNIKPADYTIVIDADPAVCQWWKDWSRTKKGRALEIHHCDGIEWLRFRFKCSEYSDTDLSDTGSGDGRSSDNGSHIPRHGTKTQSRDRMSEYPATEYFIFADPPYVLSTRLSGPLYNNEMSDEDHQRLTGTVTTIPATQASIMICGYVSDLYSPLEHWDSIDHRVPTRRGLKDERLWMNYQKPVDLHDFRYIGDSRRQRERIRRRQINWRKQLLSMSEQERLAMLHFLNSR